MRTLKQAIHYCVFIFVLAEVQLLSSRAIAQEERMLRLEARNSRINEFAHERYQLLTDIQNKVGFFPLIDNEVCFCTVIFPIGRSDRAYGLFLPIPYRSETLPSRYVLCCFQRTRTVTQVVYKIDLISMQVAASNVRANTHKPPTSLLDYIKIYQMALPPRVTATDLKDLAIQRDYVGYKYEFGDYTLRVSLFSAYRDGLVTDEGYSLDDVLATKGENSFGLPPFYQKYGLPPASVELKSIIRHSH
jgi:hypothetical protein